MATNKLFSVVGISKGDKGDYKVRFANDIGRVKVLTRAGHEDIRLAELPEAVTKLEAVKAILDMAEFQDSVSQQLFDDYIAEHGELAKPKKDQQTRPAVSLPAWNADIATNH